MTMQKISKRYSVYVFVALALFVASSGYLLGRIKYSSDNVGNKAASLGAASVIVPHHLLAQQIIDDTLRSVVEKNQGTRVDRLVIISPNHFHTGYAPVQTRSTLDYWNVPDGMTLDHQATQLLVDQNIAVSSDDAFRKEHGIYGLLPFLDLAFPSVPIVPIMMSESASPETAFSVADALFTLPGNTIVVISADFSHELSSTVSDVHDAHAIRVLQNRDVASASLLDVDNPAGLIIGMRFATLYDQTLFTLQENSNSSRILGKEFFGENTSYVAGYYSPDTRTSVHSTPDSLNTVDLLFFSDHISSSELPLYAFDPHARSFTKTLAPLRRLFLSQDWNILFPHSFSSATTLSLDPQHSFSILERSIYGHEISILRYCSQDTVIPDTYYDTISTFSDRTETVIVSLCASSNQEFLQTLTQGSIDSGAQLVVLDQAFDQQPLVYYHDTPIASMSIVDSQEQQISEFSFSASFFSLSDTIGPSMTTIPIQASGQQYTLSTP